MAKNQIKSMVTKYKGVGFKHKLWLLNDLWNHFWLLYHMNNFSNFYWGLTLCQNSNWYWNESELKSKISNQKMQISCFIIRKIENIIFEGIKLKTAGKMYFHTRLMISEWLLGLFHFLVYYCGFQFFPHEAYFRVKLKNKRIHKNSP